jgi:predicted acetyltransferase
MCLAPDDPLPLWIGDPRQVRTVEMNDALWVRLLDAPAFFGARRYQVADEIVLEVTGDVEQVSGRWRLAGGPEHGACAPSTSPPDVRLSPETLAAVSLGAIPVHQHARAGRIVEATPGAVDRLARFLRWEPVPYCATNF